jgi:hypothetical protein
MIHHLLFLLQLLPAALMHESPPHPSETAVTWSVFSWLLKNGKLHPSPAVMQPQVSISKRCCQEPCWLEPWDKYPAAAVLL